MSTPRARKPRGSAAGYQEGLHKTRDTADEHAGGSRSDMDFDLSAVDLDPSHGVFVCPIVNMLLGNQVLEVYRGFWFAAIRGIPFSRVIISKRVPDEPMPQSVMLRRIRNHYVAPELVNALNVHRVNGGDVTRTIPEGRRAYHEMPIPSSGGIGFQHAGYLYPELPWERSLFVNLFDDEATRLALVSAHSDILCGNTVGYAVRRGNFRGCKDRRWLSPANIVADWARIVDEYHGMVSIIATSDEPSFLHAVLHDNAFLQRFVRVFTASATEELFLLSMCDSIVVNRQLQSSSSWVTNPLISWESTFGQLAQLLSRSYKYKNLPYRPKPGDVDRTKRGCDCSYPPTWTEAWQ